MLATILIKLLITRWELTSTYLELLHRHSINGANAMRCVEMHFNEIHNFLFVFQTCSLKTIHQTINETFTLKNNCLVIISLLGFLFAFDLFRLGKNSPFLKR